MEFQLMFISPAWTGLIFRQDWCNNIDFLTIIQPINHHHVTKINFLKASDSHFHHPLLSPQPEYSRPSSSSSSAPVKSPVSLQS